MAYKRIRINSNKLGYTTRTIHTSGSDTYSHTLKPTKNITNTTTYLGNGKTRYTNTTRDANGFITKKQRTVGGKSKIKKYKSRKSSGDAEIIIALIFLFIFIFKMIFSFFKWIGSLFKDG